jgi:hypothetical protein
VDDANETLCVCVYVCVCVYMCVCVCVCVSIYIYATSDPEKDCCNKEVLVSDWIKTFYYEAILKLKEASVRFKNISPSDALLKNEINNEHTPALLYINPSFTDWVQIVHRRGIFLNNSRRYRLTILPIFLFVY